MHRRVSAAAVSRGTDRHASHTLGACFAEWAAEAAARRVTQRRTFKAVQSWE